MSNVHVLYRFYSATGQLLYVGITMSPPERFRSHSDTKDWWELVSGITVENYSSREELEQAERRAIQVERPLHNVVHNGKRKLHLVPRQTEGATAEIEAACSCRGEYGMLTGDQLDWHLIGLERESPGDFLLHLYEWLSDGGSVRLQANGGGWDIVLRIDGTYFDKKMALYIGDCFQHEIHGIAQQIRDNPQLCGSAEQRNQCPICGEGTIFAKLFDRHFHQDGSDNAACWLALNRMPLVPAPLGAGA